MAQMAARACQWFGVAMVTMSIDLSSMSLRRSCTKRGSAPGPSRRRATAAADDRRVGVADVGDDAVVLAGEAADVAHAAAVDADDGDVEPFVGAAFGLLGRFNSFTQKGRGRERRGTLEEISTIQKMH